MSVHRRNLQVRTKKPDYFSLQVFWIFRGMISTRDTDLNELNGCFYYVCLLQGIHGRTFC